MKPFRGSNRSGWPRIACALGVVLVLSACERSSKETHTVTAAAGGGGEITPGTVDVEDGATASFTVSASPGFRILAVTGCDGSLSGNTYTTSSIEADCVINATFIATHIVHAVAGPGGSIGPTRATVDDGATAHFTVIPDSGHAVHGVAGCGGSLSGATYTTGAVTAGCVVTASFVPTHTVRAVAGPGGRVDPTIATVNEGATVGLTVTADPGYLATVSGCGGTFFEGTYTTGIVLADCTVTASFAPVVLASPTPHAIKTLRFTWSAVAGATEYALVAEEDGAPGFSPLASVGSAGSHDLLVSLPLHVGARYALRACNPGGCADSAPVAVAGSLASAVGYVKASNTDANDHFGYSVAISRDGNTLAVGAFLERSKSAGIDGDQSDDSFWNAGAVYVFTRHGSAWVQQAYVKASNPSSEAEFGSAVALSADGSTLAVGAEAESSVATYSGAVYVFGRVGSTWYQQAYIKAFNARTLDQFGGAVALSGDGDTLAVGAQYESSGATGIDGDPWSDGWWNRGAVYVYIRNGGTWTRQAYVKPSNTGAGASFGSDVSLSVDGDTLAVGARGESTAAPSSGAAYVFVRNDGSWSEQACVRAASPEIGAWFGDAVALSSEGDTLAVGARSADVDVFGPGGDLLGGEDSGAVYVFTRSAGAWTQEAALHASHPGAGDSFGDEVALSSDGDTLAVGALREDSAAVGFDGDQGDDSAPEAGAVYLFSRSAGVWRQRAYVKAPSNRAGDAFGSAVSLSGDGETLAVGAAGESSAAFGVGGNPDSDWAAGAGAAYLF